MDLSIIKIIAITIGTSVVVIYLCRLMRIPTIVGFLISGVIIGPYGLRLIHQTHDVEILAEIGVVLLLFTIGVEFSLRRLWKIRRIVIGGGFLQVALTSWVGMLIFMLLGQKAPIALFYGFLLALSSTAIVLKSLQETAQIDSPHGRIALGILIFQDIVIIPMILLTPVLAGSETSHISSSAMVINLIKGIIIVAATIAAANWVVGHILYQVAKTRSGELFLLTVILICLLVAWITHLAGLSLALGAFLAGLVISETEYSHETLGNIVPFRNLFMTFFFVSIGMMLNIGYLATMAGIIIIAAITVLLIKFLLGTVTAIALNASLRTAIISGIALSQIGEFSFILSREGFKSGLITSDSNQFFLAVAIICMALTPFLIQIAPSVGNYLTRLNLRFKDDDLAISHDEKSEQPSGHLVIIGYGLIGSNVAKTAKAANIPYVIVEMNPETVKRELAKGEPIIFGDAVRETILEKAHVKSAKVVLIAINDPYATHRITHLVKRLNPSVYLIVRTRYVDEMKTLYDSGADEVIPEEFETSVEIFARILSRYMVPKTDIENLINEVRSDGYEMLRSIHSSTFNTERIIPTPVNIDICTLRVSESSSAVNKSINSLSLRTNFGITVVAIQRGDNVIPNPDPDTTLQINDILFVIGSPKQISDASRLFEPLCK